jgi:hypothetical protein
VRARQSTTCKAVAALFAIGAVAFLAAPAASADVTTVGLGGWQVQSTAQATQAPAAISTPGFGTASWLHVRPDDAGAPGTEVGRVRDAAGHLPARRPARRFAGSQRVGSELAAAGRAGVVTSASS